MRRVVVTGLGMVTPLGCGVRADLEKLIDGKSGASKVEAFDVSDIACKIACSLPRGDGTGGSFNPISGWSRRNSARSILSSSMRWRPPPRRRGRRLEADDLRGSVRFGRADRFRHRRHRRHLRCVDYLASADRGVFPVLHTRPPDQPGRRLRVHRARAQGPEQRSGHRLLDGLARNRRRRG